MEKILILCPFSLPSACGVWTRAWSDAQALKQKGYDVTIFSSDIVKGTRSRSPAFETVDGINIHRFPVMFSLGGTSMFWNFFGALKKLNPELIHTHGYRHPHSLFALVLGKFMRKKVLLTTHAPFNKSSQRSLVLKLIDILYDCFIGWWELRSYNRVIRISKWEEPFLQRLGLRNSLLIPNGVSAKFFAAEPLERLVNEQPKKSILYMGRIDPVKRLEWIINAAVELPEYQFKILGPLDGYDEFKALSSNVEIITKHYNADDFITNSRSSDIYVLPSIREALPFTLLEAMSQGMIAVSSNTLGGQEVIVNAKNGFIVESESALKETLVEIYRNWSQVQQIRAEAVKTAGYYSEKNSVVELLNLYDSF